MWYRPDILLLDTNPDTRLEPDLMQSHSRVNYEGAFFACQAAARQMAKQGDGGSIIAISSISALVGGGQQTHYTPTKAAILSLTQSMAIALGKYKIRVNALLPGTIRTQLNEEDLANEEKRKYTESRIPLGRTGEPNDLAGPAVFLACDELSGYVNGAQLLVDGGMFVNLQ
jgi:L-rhamnose 1-dehydrogenase